MMKPTGLWITIALPAAVMGLAAPALPQIVDAACSCQFVDPPQPTGVQVKQKGSADGYVAVRVHMVVHSGDLLKVPPASGGRLICDGFKGTRDLKPQTLPEGVPCQPAKQKILSDSGSKWEIRTMSVDTSVSWPLVLGPRATKVLTPQPMLKWQTVPDATEYQVTVRGGGIEWKKTVPAADGKRQMDIEYPAGAPALTPGVTYKLIVAPGNPGRDADDEPGLGFEVVPEDTANAIVAELKQVDGLGLSPASKDLMAASIYASHELYQDAINRLERLAQTSTDPDVHMQLGYLYLDAHLPRLAEKQLAPLLAAPQASGLSRAEQARLSQLIDAIRAKLAEPANPPR